MITTCTNCQARYQLENAKIPARVIQVRCPACQGVFALDGALAQAEETAAVDDYSVEAPAPVEAPVVAESTFEKPAPVEKPQVSEPVQSEEAAPEMSPFAQPAAEVQPIPSPAATLAPAASSACVATLDEPAPAAGKTRRRRCKEEMLARALVSDILVYNRETRDAGLQEGNLLEALGGEIKKSWELYKEKVTPEVANSTTYFREALNDILADGTQVF